MDSSPFPCSSLYVLISPRCKNLISYRFSWPSCTQCFQICLREKRGGFIKKLRTHTVSISQFTRFHCHQYSPDAIVFFIGFPLLRFLFFQLFFAGLFLAIFIHFSQPFFHWQFPCLLSAWDVFYQAPWIEPHFLCNTDIIGAQPAPALSFFPLFFWICHPIPL